MVVGAHAVFVYGALRYSGDLDVALALRVSEKERVRKVLARHGMKDLDWREDPEWGRRWMGIDPTGLPVEFFLAGDSPVNERDYERRRVVQIEGTPVAIVSPEDLILRKLVNCRLRKAHDFEDAIGILRAQAGKLDIPYVRRHCGLYRVCALLDEAILRAEEQERTDP